MKYSEMITTDDSQKKTKKKKTIEIRDQIQNDTIKIQSSSRSNEMLESILNTQEKSFK